MSRSGADAVAQSLADELLAAVDASSGRFLLGITDRRRLIERQIAGGRSETDAFQHVDESDLPDAELVARTRQLADTVIRP